MKYRFDIGQRVCVKKGVKRDEHLGEVGIVSDIGWNDDYPIRVDFNRPKPGEEYTGLPSMRYKEDELELWNGIIRARKVINGK